MFTYLINIFSKKNSPNNKAGNSIRDPNFKVPSLECSLLNDIEDENKLKEDKRDIQFAFNENKFFYKVEDIHKYLKEGNNLPGLDSEFNINYQKIISEKEAQSIYLNDNWISTDVDWKCPACERKKQDIIYLDKNRTLRGVLVFHHDHIVKIINKITLKNKVPDGLVYDQIKNKLKVALKSLIGFSDILICESCNNACATLKARIKLQGSPYNNHLRKHFFDIFKSLKLKRCNNGEEWDAIFHDYYSLSVREIQTIFTLSKNSPQIEAHDQKIIDLFTKNYIVTFFQKLDYAEKLTNALLEIDNLNFENFFKDKTPAFDFQNFSSLTLAPPLSEEFSLSEIFNPRGKVSRTYYTKSIPCFEYKKNITTKLPELSDDETENFLKENFESEISNWRCKICERSAHEAIKKIEGKLVFVKREKGKFCNECGDLRNKTLKCKIVKMIQKDNLNVGQQVLEELTPSLIKEIIISAKKNQYLEIDGKLATEKMQQICDKVLLNNSPAHLY